MKATLFFATLSMLFAMPCKSAQTELESLRKRCQQQEERIRQLEGQLKQAGEKLTTPATSAERVSETGPSAANDSHIVKAGDNIEKIARRHGCTAGTLYQLNGLKPTSIIHPGQRIKLPAKTALATNDKQSQAVAAADRAAEKPADPARFHRIKQGETYSSISRDYKIPVNTLIALNPTIKATALRPGLSIRLNHGKATATAPKQVSALASAESKSGVLTKSQATKTIATTQKADSPAKPPTPSPDPVAKSTTPAPAQHATKETSPNTEPATHSPAPDSVAQAKQTPPSTPPAADPGPTAQSESSSKVERKIRSVKIDEPMTYGEFAAKHGTDSSRLNDLNGLDLTQATVLAKGSELYVPAQP